MGKPSRTKAEGETMNAADFRRAVALAESGQELVSFQAVCERFFGFGLRDWEPRAVTLAEVASLIRYQAGLIFRPAGCPRWDMEALEDVRRAARLRFILID